MSSATRQIEDVYALSPMQEAMMFHKLYDQTSVAYFLQNVFHIQDKLQVEHVQKSLRELSRRHDILRTAFVHKDVNRPLQIVVKDRAIAFHFEDISGLGDAIEKERFIEDFKKKDQQRSFDLAKDPLMRVNLFRLAERDYIFIWSYHHILMDGWCMSIITAEYYEIYNSLQANRPSRLQPPPQYKQYIQWLSAQDQSASKDYWADYLNGYEKLCGIPARHVAERKNPAGGKEQLFFEIDQDKTTQLATLARKHGVTMNTLMEVLWGILLSKYNNTADVVFGAIVSGRPGSIEGIDKMLGLFINTVPVRVKFEAGMTFSELLIGVQQEALQGSGYHFTPLAEIQAGHALKNNLLNHILVFENYPVAPAGNTVNATPDGTYDTTIALKDVFEHNNYDFTITIAAEERLRVRIDYNTALFDQYFIHNIPSHLLQLIEQVLQQSDAEVRKLTIVGPEEEELLLRQFNHPVALSSAHRTLAQLFEEQANLQPDHIALVIGERTLRYRELNEQSNRLAHWLRKHLTLQPDALIGIMAERSEWMIIGILGILKAGAGYVPIDPSYPEERKTYIINDSGIQCLLTDVNTPLAIPAIDRLVRQDIRELLAAEENITNPATINGPEHLAYVMYTSGSTGKPKGVAVEQRSVVNLAKHSNYTDIQPHHRLLQLSNFAFDGSVFDIFASLLNGAVLCLLDRETMLSGDRLAAYIEDQGINVMFITTALFNSFIELNPAHISYFDKIYFGGEYASVPHIQTALQYRKHPDSIVHVYGPTETTTFATFHIIYSLDEDALSIPIGIPLSNVNVYLLNDQLQLQPAGVEGEIYIGGEGLARGYLNQEELTGERFIPNSFRPGTRFYRTGDIGRWNENGQVEYIGRRDTQIKLRGHRIELGEIESVLDSYPGIESGIVTAHGTGNDKYIVGYYKSRQEVDETALRKYLHQSLPEYMVPAYLLKVTEYPLTSTGKTDRNKLPDPLQLRHEAPQTHKRPATATQEQLVRIWEEVLETKHIGIGENFFELGGHSIKAIRVLLLVSKELDAQVELNDIFEHPTIEELAALIDNKAKTVFSQIPVLTPQPRYALSHAQKRLWVIDQLDGQKTTYNIFGAYRIEGKLEVNSLQKAFEAIIDRHESLRTVFVVESDQPFQVIRTRAETGYKLAYTDLRAQSNSREMALGICEQEAAQPFDLTSGPLLRTQLLQLGDREFIFLLTLHHIIADAWSMEILVGEVLSYYNHFSQGLDTAEKPLTIQYKEYAAWQNGLLQQEDAASHKHYWHQQLAGELPVLHLPTDYLRPAIKTNRGSVATIMLSRPLQERIQEKSRSTGASTFMILLAAVKILLHRYTGQNDIIIGTSIAGRQHADLVNQIGFFVNTLALRTHITEEQAIGSLLQHVKEVTMGAYEHQLYPFDKLVEELNLPRNMSRMPVFDVMVVLLNNELGGSEATSWADLSISDFAAKPAISKFDLIFNFKESDQGILLQIEYSTDLFRSARIERMLQHYSLVAAAIVQENPGTVGQIELLSGEEQEQIHAFNNTANQPGIDKTVIDWFEEQAGRLPDDSALMWAGKEYSYRWLNEKANQLAHWLRNHCAVSAGDLVGIMMDRSEWMIVSMLGILKSGAGYVPLDASYPAERLEYMAKDAGVRCILTAPGTTTGFKDSATIRFEPISPGQVDEQATTNLPRQATATDIAYVLYTSGSTGQPKGCVIEHRSLVNYLQWAIGYYFGEATPAHFGLFTSLSFDFTLTSIFCTLLSGGRLTLFSQSTSIQEVLTQSFAAGSGITAIKLTPSHLHILGSLPVLPGTIQLIIVGGEALTQQQVAIIRNIDPAIRIVNEYGPTEATVGCVVKEITTEQEKVLIGKPVHNMRIYIVDQQLQLVPIGVEGEIGISGIGLARGYLNRDELTRQKFIDNPFEPGTRLYRTGDRGRWLEDGHIEYLGRHDEQVKLRGYRVELGEIEQVLAGYAPIESAVVVARGEGADRYLVAYYKSPEAVDESALRQYLSGKLPDYMVPAWFVQVEAYPLTVNGKLDKSKLPEPASAMEGQSYIPPSNDAEAMLVKIWEKVLGRAPISITDNFIELGGDSIKAIQISIQLYKTGHKLEIMDLFRNPTVRALSKIIGGMGVEKMADQSAVSGIVPLTPIQQAFFQAAHPKPHHYNQSVLLHAAQGYERAAVEAVITHLQLHHDALRMVFKTTPGNTLQENLGTDHPVQVQEFDLRQTANATDQLETIANDIQAGIDLQNGPLLQAALFKMNDGDRLLIVVHHLVIDGISWRILFEDFATLYRQYNAGEPLTLPAKTDSFKRWAEKLQDFANTPAFLQQKAYWQALEKTTVFPLRKDSDGPVTNQVSDTSTGTFELDEQETDLLLTKVNRAYATEINDILLSALAMAVATTIGQRQVLIALEGHGRENILPAIDINRTIGWFTSLYPVIIDINPAHDLSRQLREVKETLRQVPNKGIGHGMLKYLTTPSLKEDMAFHLEPEISFNYLGQFDADLSNASLQTADETTGQNYSEDTNRSYHIDVIAIVTGGHLQVSVVYNRHLYRSSTMNSFLQAFKQSLQQIITHCASGQHHTVTPSDLTFKGLSVEELENFFE